MPGGDITHIDLDHFARVVPDTLSSVGVTACCDQQGEHGTVWSRSEQVRTLSRAGGRAILEGQ